MVSHINTFREHHNRDDNHSLMLTVHLIIFSYRYSQYIRTIRLNTLRRYGEKLGHCNASRSCTVQYHDGREMKIGRLDRILAGYNLLR